MSQLPSRKTDLVALKSMGRVTTDFNSSRVKPRVTQFFSEIPPLFRYTVSVSFTHARDMQGSYGVHLGARQTTLGGEQRGGQVWAWWAARRGSCEGALEREFAAPGWGWLCWEQGTGWAPDRWWSPEGLPSNNSYQTGFLCFRSWWYSSSIQVTNKAYLFALFWVTFGYCEHTYLYMFGNLLYICELGKA